MADNRRNARTQGKGDGVEPEHVALIAIVAVLIPTLAVGRKRQRAGVGWGESRISPASPDSSEAKAAAERSCSEGWWASVLLRLFMALGVNLAVAIAVFAIAAVAGFVCSFFGFDLDLGAYTATALILLGLFTAAGVGGAVCYKACEGDAAKAGRPLPDALSSGAAKNATGIGIIHLLIETVERHLGQWGASVPPARVYTIVQYLLLAVQIAIIVLDIVRSL